MSTPNPACIVFDGDHCLGTGDLRAMAELAKAALDCGGVPIVMFDAITSHRIEFDLRGSLDEILARLPVATEPEQPAAMAAEPAPRGPGRPKLGVVAREVTLLPRHWEWLAQQRGGASVALRRLVDAARHANRDQDRTQQALDSTYRFIAVMAASYPDYEEALRALFARDPATFEQWTSTWPVGVRDHARRLASSVFAPAPTEAVAG